MFFFSSSYIYIGLMSIHYTYQANTNLVKNINVVEPGFELKHEIRYHLGTLKDERYSFSAKCGLQNTHFKYVLRNEKRLLLRPCRLIVIILYLQIPGGR